MATNYRRLFAWRCFVVVYYIATNAFFACVWNHEFLSILHETKAITAHVINKRTYLSHSRHSHGPVFDIRWSYGNTSKCMYPRNTLCIPTNLGTNSNIYLTDTMSKASRVIHGQQGQQKVLPGDTNWMSLPNRLKYQNLHKKWYAMDVFMLLVHVCALKQVNYELVMAQVQSNSHWHQSDWRAFADQFLPVHDYLVSQMYGIGKCRALKMIGNLKYSLDNLAG